MDGASLKFLAAGIAMVGSFGAGIGLGNLFSTWIGSISRNPAAEGKYKQIGFIGFAAIELVLLMCFVVAALLIFAV